MNLTENLTVISFSGGRSSAYMTQMLLHLPKEERIIVFANTGKEHESTLKFVHDFEQHFKEKIYWIEYRPENRFKEVDYKTASRAGEPFAALIDKRKYLPNIVTRFCTGDLKIKPIKYFIESLGYKEWDNAIGIRYDEPLRYAKLANACKNEPYETIAPLYTKRITKQQVNDFWANMPFDLEIPNYLGNCDMCFLKRNRLKTIIKEEPGRAQWWVDQEEKFLTLAGKKATFIKDYSYTELINLIKSQPELDFSIDEIECFCNID